MLGYCIQQECDTLFSILFVRYFSSALIICLNAFTKIQNTCPDVIYGSECVQSNVHFHSKHIVCDVPMGGKEDSGDGSR